MDGLMGPAFFQAMLEEDMETERLKKIPGVQVEERFTK